MRWLRAKIFGLLTPALLHCEGQIAGAEVKLAGARRGRGRQRGVRALSGLGQSGGGPPHSRTLARGAMRRAQTRCFWMREGQPGDTREMVCDLRSAQLGHALSRRGRRRSGAPGKSELNLKLQMNLQIAKVVQ